MHKLIGLNSIVWLLFLFSLINFKENMLWIVLVFSPWLSISLLIVSSNFIAKDEEQTIEINNSQLPKIVPNKPVPPKCRRLKESEDKCR